MRSVRSSASAGAGGRCCSDRQWSVRRLCAIRYSGPGAKAAGLKCANDDPDCDGVRTQPQEGKPNEPVNDELNPKKKDISLLV